MAEVPEQLRSALRGRYDLQRELGRGGMASVYLARDLRYDRSVAIKVLSEPLAASVGRARFLLEIRIAAQLSHPHILPLLDSGEAGDLLYYVMPYVEGESLKDRIEREKQLPIREAIAIAREVAAGLGHAHGQGIVHRDVKPGNILLSGGSAVIADFGIARAVRRSATDDTLTDVNLAIGTPPYMSPEQWSGTRELDQHSDIYSLGCVVYEMLAGQPPFTGSTTEAIAARVVFDPVPPIRTVRPKVSRALERAILKALEKVPADRFATVTEFADALAAARSSDKPPIPPIVRWLAAAAGGVGVAAAAIFVIPRIIDARTATVDTTLYAVLPFKYEQGTAPSNEDQAMRDALGRWSGITVVDPFQVRDAVGRSGGSDLSAGQALGVASRVKAGRYVRAEVSRIGDSLRIRGFVFDGTRGAKLHDAAIKVDADRAHVEAALTALADSLLFRDREPSRRREPVVGTSSFPARQAYARGHRAIEAWDLAAADSALALATTYDPQYAQAFLWLAQVRAWSGAPPSAWRSPVERALAHGERLAPQDRWHADALRALNGDDFAHACASFESATVRTPADHAVWYSLASCLSADQVVIRDPLSPTGWRFRSSYHRATVAYQRAFQLLPAIHQSLGHDSYATVRRLLMTSGSTLRMGHANPPDNTTFLSYPSRLGDSLAFVPYPAREFERPNPQVIPPTRDLAVRRQREMFHDIAVGWVVAYPASPDAMLALAVSLDMLGDESALDTLRTTRALATAPDQRLRVAAIQVWTLLKYSLPGRPAGIREARALVDSLLGEYRATVPHPGLLASLAVLTGRALRAAELGRQAHTRDPWSFSVAGPIARDAPALLVFSALGGPRDSIRALEDQVEAAIARDIPEAERDRVRREWLVHAASLAFPDYQFPSLRTLGASGYPVVDAQRAATRGDTAAALRILEAVRPARAAVPPADRTFDATFSEAALLASLGDTLGAIAALDAPLNALRASTPDALADVPASAGLVRAMALRAQLAAARGDRRTARLLAGAVVTLWSGADAYLQPVVQRMRALEAQQ